jgi:hypothetical protein
MPTSYMPDNVRKIIAGILCFIGLLCGHAATFRPPSVPLVACDPYFSIWSPADQLNGSDTTHWTGKPHRLVSLARIDHQVLRVMGKEPADVPAMKQTGVQVLPTRTICTFAGAGVQLTVTFFTPALPEDISILSRPVTYVSYEAMNMDGRMHNVSVYFEAAAEIAVNTPNQLVTWNTEKVPGLHAVRVGSVEQPILQKKGDDLRIDWGYLYLAAPQGGKSLTAIAPAAEARQAFAKDGMAELTPDSRKQATAAEAPVLVCSLELPEVFVKPVSRWMILAYDDIYSIQYMKKNLRPYWRRDGWEASDLLQASAREFKSLDERGRKFDAELMADLEKAGGPQYSALCALSYRQCFAAGKFVADENGQPLSFCKENHSNGCIGTSDVFYPMAPQFLLFGPSIAKSFLVPFMNYAASPRWKFSFAPHDLGTYPHANGQVYGGGERTEENQMPVEESGNLLLLIAAVAKMEGNADFASKYWPQLESWANYLRSKGFDPENQLCTDDFAGHLAHNVNLSAKAICGIKAFAMLCKMRGERAATEEFSGVAASCATRWLKEADDGDHYRLAFDRQGSWSQKYNLVWDRVLGLDLFPMSALRKEMDYYKKIQNKYGLPLDNRETYTKLDWILWTATLTRDRNDFDALLSNVMTFINETPDRSPLTDWYQTKTARKVGFTARPVIGGVFMETLYHPELWQKWARRDRTKAANYAPMPTAPELKVVVPSARENKQITWRYTTDKPGPDWFETSFQDSNWKQGTAGFGTSGTPGAVIGSKWASNDIWLRRSVELPAGSVQNLRLLLHHDEDAQVYINGVLAAQVQGYTSDYEEVPLTTVGAAAIKAGSNVIAVHCHQTGGGQYIDVGFVQVK